MVDPRGTVTSVRSPFGDSFEVGGEDGGIKVHRTVEISRILESDEEGDEGSQSVSGFGRSERDLV
jgi:hypothetical protein